MDKPSPDTNALSSPLEPGCFLIIKIGDVFVASTNGGHVAADGKGLFSTTKSTDPCDPRILWRLFQREHYVALQNCYSRAWLTASPSAQTRVFEWWTAESPFESKSRGSSPLWQLSINRPGLRKADAGSTYVNFGLVSALPSTDNDSPLYLCVKPDGTLDIEAGSDGVAFRSEEIFELRRKSHLPTHDWSCDSNNGVDRVSMLDASNEPRVLGIELSDHDGDQVPELRELDHFRYPGGLLCSAIDRHGTVLAVPIQDPCSVVSCNARGDSIWRQHGARQMGPQLTERPIVSIGMGADEFMLCTNSNRLYSFVLSNRPRPPYFFLQSYNLEKIVVQVIGLPTPNFQATTWYALCLDSTILVIHGTRRYPHSQFDSQSVVEPPKGVYFRQVSLCHGQKLVALSSDDEIWLWENDAANSGRGRWSIIQLTYAEEVPDTSFGFSNMVGTSKGLVLGIARHKMAVGTLHEHTISLKLYTTPINVALLAPGGTCGLLFGVDDLLIVGVVVIGSMLLNTVLATQVPDPLSHQQTSISSAKIPPQPLRGKKRALLVRYNTGPSSTIHDFKRQLQYLGFDESDIKMLYYKNDPWPNKMNEPTVRENGIEAPTGTNFKREFEQLISQTQAGDVRCVFIDAHGTNLDVDEQGTDQSESGDDEGIKLALLDDNSFDSTTSQRSVIVSDNWMSDMVKQHLHTKANLTMISISCRGSGLLDLHRSGRKGLLMAACHETQFNLKVGAKLHERWSAALITILDRIHRDHNAVPTYEDLWQSIQARIKALYIQGNSQEPAGSLWLGPSPDPGRPLPIRPETTEQEQIVNGQLTKVKSTRLISNQDPQLVVDSSYLEVAKVEFLGSIP